MAPWESAWSVSQRERAVGLIHIGNSGLCRLRSREEKKLETLVTEILETAPSAVRL